LAKRSGVRVYLDAHARRGRALDKEMLLGRLAVFGAAVLTAGFATVEPHAATTFVAPAAVAVRATAEPVLRLAVDSTAACPVASGSVIGPCPRRFVGKSPVTAAPVLKICAPIREIPLMSGWRAHASLCGGGFHPKDRVDVMTQGRYGSTQWRVTADVHGRFRSPLPWPLCALTPGKIVAIDFHEARSNALTLPGSGCP